MITLWSLIDGGERGVGKVGGWKIFPNIDSRGGGGGGGFEKN